MFFRKPTGTCKVELWRTLEIRTLYSAVVCSRQWTFKCDRDQITDTVTRLVSLEFYLLACERRTGFSIFHKTKSPIKRHKKIVVFYRIVKEWFAFGTVVYNTVGRHDAQPNLTGFVYKCSVVFNLLRYQYTVKAIENKTRKNINTQTKSFGIYLNCLCFIKRLASAQVCDCPNRSNKQLQPVKNPNTKI